MAQPRLSYRVFGDLLAGKLDGRAGAPIHYALYEPGEILLVEKLLFQIYITVETFLTISCQRGHMEDGSLRWLSTEVYQCPFDPSNLSWVVNQCSFDPYQAGAKVYRAY